MSKVMNMWFLVFNIVFYFVSEKINYTLIKNIENSRENINTTSQELNDTIFLYTPSNVSNTKLILEKLTKISSNKAFITNLNLANSQNSLELTLKAQDINNLYSYLNELSTSMKGIFTIKYLVINSNEEQFTTKENIRKKQEEEDNVPFIIKYLNKQNATKKKQKGTTNTEKINIKEYNYEAIITLGDFK